MQRNVKMIVKHLRCFSTRVSRAQFVQNVMRSRIKGILEDYRKYWKSQECLFLGLDVSTSSTGIALLDASGRLLESAVTIPPPSAGGNGGSVLSAGALISQVCQYYARKYPQRVAEVSIEDFAMAFQPQQSTAAALTTLARINGIAAFEAWKCFQAPILYYHPTSLRSYFGIKQSRSNVNSEIKKRASSKESSRALSKRMVLEYILSIYPDFPTYIMEGDSSIECSNSQSLLSLVDGPTDTLSQAKTVKKRSKATGIKANLKGNSPQNDQADAILVAMYSITQRLEWAALTHADGLLFKEFMTLQLPGSRVNQITITEDHIPSLIRALNVLHKQAIASQAIHRRIPDFQGTITGIPTRGVQGSMPPPLGGLVMTDVAEPAITASFPGSTLRGPDLNSDHTLQVESPNDSNTPEATKKNQCSSLSSRILPPLLPVPHTTPKTARGLKKQRDEAILSMQLELPRAVDSDALDRLYNRQREAFRNLVRDLILDGSFLPWVSLSAEVEV